MTKERTDMLRLLKIELGGIEKKFNKSDFELDIKPLLRLVLSQIFGNSSQAIVEAMNFHFQTAKDAIDPYIKQNYLRTENQGTRLFNKLIEGSSKGPLCINVLKQYYSEKQGDFHLFGKILSGTISKGQTVKILGEKFT